MSADGADGPTMDERNISIRDNMGAAGAQRSPIYTYACKYCHFTLLPRRSTPHACVAPSAPEHLQGPATEELKTFLKRVETATHIIDRQNRHFIAEDPDDEISILQTP